MPENNEEFGNRVESLGPAELAIKSLTTVVDHMAHGRPGIVVQDGTSPVGVKWLPCVRKGDEILTQHKIGKKTENRLVGTVNGTNAVMNGATKVGEYRVPSDTNKLFPEVAAYIYKQIADIWAMDNGFAAHWASFAFNQENRDLKTVLAAFMLVQDRAGVAVIENGKTLFFDDDYRAVGEAMFLVKGKGYRQMEPQQIVRVGDLLDLPEIAAINRELGFGKSAKKAAKGRYEKAVTKWLRYREHNPQMLEGLLKSGQASVVRDLAKRVRYKPESDAFFNKIGWKQTNKPHRTIKSDVQKASLAGMTEQQICEYVVDSKINYKRLAGLMPDGQDITRAIMAACIDAGGLSEKDLIIMTPTLDALGLLKIEPYAGIWKTATENARDQRAANIARNAKSKEAKDGLEVAVDVATSIAIEKVTREMRVYFMVDISASMNESLEKAKGYIKRFLGGFPPDRLHSAVFNTQGRELDIKSPTASGVEQAFRGYRPSGGTLYSSGVQALIHNRPEPNEDVLFIFVGDQAGESANHLASFIRQSGLNPMAFGFLYVPGYPGNTVEATAQLLNIPCFGINEAMFVDDDPYAVTRTLSNLIASTPTAVGGTVQKRETLIEQILKTKLLEVPDWAAPKPPVLESA